MRRGDTSNLRIQLKRKTKALLSTLDLKKLLLMNIPYIFVFLFADRASCLYRLTPSCGAKRGLIFQTAILNAPEAQSVSTTAATPREELTRYLLSTWA